MATRDGGRHIKTKQRHIKLLVCYSFTAHLYARCLNLRGRVGWLADAHDAHHVLLLELSNVHVQIVSLGGVHDSESELLPLHQRHLSRHGARFDPA